MRIWAFPSFYPIDRPGKKWAGIFAHRQYKGLVANGAIVNVVQPVLWAPPAPFHKLDPGWKKQAEMDYPEEREYDGLKVYHPRIANMKPGKFFRKSYEERYADALTRLFKKLGVKIDPETDIFYSQWLPESRIVQHAARRFGVRSAIMGVGDDIIVIPHESEQKMRDFKKVWKEADIRMAVADYLGREANKILGEDVPYTVIRRGVDYNFFRPATVEERTEVRKEYNIPDDKIAILSIGTAIVRKGWLDMLDALRELGKVNNNFLLVAVYAGHADFDLAEEVSKRGLTDHFLDLGEVEPKKVNRLYHAADVFCLPSHWEGIANAVVESMSCGIATLTTNVSGHPELVNSGETGIMVPPKRPDLIYKELLDLVNNAEKREMLGKNARNFIVNTWGNFNDNALLLYKRLGGR